MVEKLASAIDGCISKGSRYLGGAYNSGVLGILESRRLGIYTSVACPDGTFLELPYVPWKVHEADGDNCEMTDWRLNAIAVVLAIGVTFILLVPRIRTATLWRATVTPLASIIGSGFLIIAPLLHGVTGRWALLAITVLCILSFAIGAVLRFNIAIAEPHAALRDDIYLIEVSSQATLGAAYAISVAFYTSLFVAFLSERAPFALPQPAATTTAVLIAIGFIAWVRGTRGLEMVELGAVTIKLGIIAGVVVALGFYDFETGKEWFVHGPTVELSAWGSMSVLAGLLMVTQGFETTRFMGGRYTPSIRIRAARNAQLIAIVIYVAFIGLTCPIFLEFPIVEMTETTISSTLGQAIAVLPMLLFIAATASQLSAALADTIGGGGLLAGILPVKVHERWIYVLVIGAAVVIVWQADVFGIINLASKGFALFYLLQVVIAMRLLMRQKHMVRWRRDTALAGCSLLLLILLFVVLFSQPAPHV